MIPETDMTKVALSIIIFLHCSMCSQLTGAASIRDGWGVSTKISDIVFNQTVTIQCNIRGVIFAGDGVPPPTNGAPVASSLIIKSADRIPFVHYSFSKRGGSLSLDPSSLDKRYSYDPTTKTMTIRLVQCSDENGYLCRVVAKRSYEGRVHPVNATSSVSLLIKVPPRAPTHLQIKENDLTGGTSNEPAINAMCDAQAGRRGRIEWRLYRDAVTEVLAPDDFRTYSTRPGQSSQCYGKVFSILTLRLEDLSGKHMTVACFAVNAYFPTKRSRCASPEEDLCQVSEPIRLHHVRQNLRLVIHGKNKWFPGDNITLTCGPIYWPSKEFHWNVPNRLATNGRVLDIVNKGDVSRLRLYNINPMSHSGVYSCTVKGEMDGNLYTKTTTQRINIAMPVGHMHINPLYHTIFHGDDVKLKCAVAGWPQPETRWYKDKVDDEHLQRSRNLGEFFSRAILHLTNADTERDSGDYICVSTNVINGTKHSQNKTVHVTFKTKEDKTGGGRMKAGKGEFSKDNKMGFTTEMVAIVAIMSFGLITVGISLCHEKVYNKRRSHSDDASASITSNFEFSEKTTKTYCSHTSLY